MKLTLDMTVVFLPGFCSVEELWVVFFSLGFYNSGEINHDT